MPIEVKHQSFADCETLTIFGAKRGKGNSTNLVRVQFSSLDDLKEFQNKLNNLFPENVIINENFREPKEEGKGDKTPPLINGGGLSKVANKKPEPLDFQVQGTKVEA